jgi:hypothetical protein
MLRCIVGDADPPPTCAGMQVLQMTLMDDWRAKGRYNAR